MPHKKEHAEEEEGGESVGLWYVSFSDMITLLLSFFVMMTTFSSFSKEKLEQFAGEWDFVSNSSLFPGRNLNQDSLAPQQKHMDWTAQGSEKPPTDFAPESTQHPKSSPWMADQDKAYANQRVFYVASSRLFWGEGTSMVTAGRQHLDLIARYLKLVPCQVVIGESNPADGPDRSGRAFERAWTIVEYFVDKYGMSRDRFSIKQADSSLSQEISGKPVVEVTLLGKNVIR
jgi:flagellar motor protein MotB